MSIFFIYGKSPVWTGAEDPQEAFPGHGKLKPADEELRQLRRKLADVEEERDILKKALAVFSKRPK
jgi:transposase